MGAEDQAAVIDFLGASSTHGGMTVERIDTHSSIVFLAGARAWKLKRAVRFDYLDFSTPGFAESYSARPKCVSIDARRLPCIAEWWRSHARATGRSPWEVRESLLIGSSRWRASTRRLCSIDLPRAGD